MKRVAFAVCKEVGSINTMQYARDDLLVAALAKHDVQVEAVCWDAPDEDWSRFDLVLIRSVFDYFLRMDEFRAWLARLQGVRVANPVPILLWNADKRYLLQLQDQGLPLPRTLILRQGDCVSLTQLADQLDAAKLVVKPVFSGGSYETWTVTREDIANAQHRFAAQLARMDLIVQEFLPQVQSHGEWSLLFFDGQLSHAVIKIPQAGDFRVQVDFGATSEARQPTEAVVQLAHRVIQLVPKGWMYARVDMIEHRQGVCLIEVELIEPDLFLDCHHDAADNLARVVLKWLHTAQ